MLCVPTAKPKLNPAHFARELFLEGAWGSVVVKAPRYWSDGPGIDSRCCHWIFQ